MMLFGSIDQFPTSYPSNNFWHHLWEPRQAAMAQTKSRTRNTKPPQNQKDMQINQNQHIPATSQENSIFNNHDH